MGNSNIIPLKYHQVFYGYKQVIYKVKTEQKKESKNSYTILYYRYYSYTNSGKEDPYRGAIDWTLLFPQSSHVKILISNVIVLESGIFGRWLDHKGEALMNK